MYNEDPEISSLTFVDIAVYREANSNITASRVFLDQPLTEVPIPNPIYDFKQCFRNYPDLLAEIQKQGFAKPSPMQSQAWPVLLKGEDLIGIAQSGAGKTLAFLLPSLIHTEFQPRPRCGPNVLIMTPTSELAQKIKKEVGKYNFRDMTAVCVYGSSVRKDQIETTASGVEIIIATPGRLNDLLEDKGYDVGSITYLVLDDADCMLDMGFEQQVRKFLLLVRPDRQTVITTATWSPGVRRLAERYIINPIQVCIDNSLDLAAIHLVKQRIEVMDEKQKLCRVSASKF